MGLRRDQDDTGRGRAAQNVLQELDQVEVAQMVHLEGGLQAIFREAPGKTKHRSVAHKHMKRPGEENSLRYMGLDTFTTKNDRPREQSFRHRLPDTALLQRRPQDLCADL